MANTNDLLWQDHYDRQSGQGKYGSPNNMASGVPQGAVGNPVMLGQSLAPTGMSIRGGPWSGSNKSFREWKHANITPGGSTGYGRAAQMADFWRKIPGMSQPYLDQMDRYQEEDEIQKAAEQQFKQERVSNALSALRNQETGGPMQPFSAFEMLRKGKY